MATATINRNDWSGKSVEVEYDNDSFTVNGERFTMVFERFAELEDMSHEEQLELIALIGEGTWKVMTECGAHVCSVDGSGMAFASECDMTRENDNRYFAAVQMLCNLGLV